MTIISKAIHRFSAIPIKIPMAFFAELEQKMFTICLEAQETQVAKAILRNKNRGGGFRLPELPVVPCEKPHTGTAAPELVPCSRQSPFPYLCSAPLRCGQWMPILGDQIGRAHV